VLLEVGIAEDGSVQDVKVLRALPDGLTERAVAAVKTWRFKPFLDRDGKPVSVRFDVEVNFKLLHK
jgi:TonB family protein